MSESIVGQNQAASNAHPLGLATVVQPIPILLLPRRPTKKLSQRRNPETLHLARHRTVLVVPAHRLPLLGVAPWGKPIRPATPSRPAEWASADHWQNEKIALWASVFTEKVPADVHFRVLAVAVKRNAGIYFLHCNPQLFFNQFPSISGIGVAGRAGLVQ